MLSLAHNHQTRVCLQQLTDSIPSFSLVSLHIDSLSNGNHRDYWDDNDYHSQLIQKQHLSDNSCSILTVYLDFYLSLFIYAFSRTAEIIYVQYKNPLILYSVSVGGHLLYCFYSFPQLAAQILINIYIILAQGCMMSIFSSSDLRNIEMNLRVLPII